MSLDKDNQDQYMKETYLPQIQIQTNEDHHKEGLEHLLNLKL